MKTIFVFAYYGYHDPIFQSAVLPYLRLLGQEFRFVVLTFEQSIHKTSLSDFSKINEGLNKENIYLHKLNWHSGEFKLLKKFYDFISGILVSLFLIKKYNVSVVYSEGHPGSIIAHFLARATGLNHIVHSFEPHAEYMLEAKVWNNKSWEYVFQKRMELKVALKAKHLFTATNRYKEILNKKTHRTNISVIPSCVDTNKFRIDYELRDSLRRELNISPEEIVIVYLGKFGGMYMESELFDFIRLCKKQEHRIKFMLLSQEPESKISQLAKASELSMDDFILLSLQSSEVPKYLLVGDFGFVGVRPLPSKRFCSPIKNGEYMACGLPLIIPENVSDDFELVSENELGIVFTNLSSELIEEIASYPLSNDNKERIREVCIKNRDIVVYTTLLKKVLTET